MPSRVRKDEGAVSEHPGSVLDEPHRLFADERLDLAAPEILPFEQVGELARAAGIAGEKELDGRIGAVEATGGVDPRAHPEPDLGCAERAFFNSGRIQQGPHAGARAGAEQLEAMVHQHPVFTEQRGDVGHGAEGNEIEV